VSSSAAYEKTACRRTNGSRSHAFCEVVGAADAVEAGELRLPGLRQQVVRLEALMRDRGVVLRHASLVPLDELEYTSPRVV
jgi:hypothetical protein